jgi:hypothetical protein
MNIESAFRYFSFIIWAVGVTLTLQSSSSSGSTLDLRRLYAPAEYKTASDNTGNFVVFDNGNVLFFNPSQRLEFASILLGLKDFVQANCIIFDPSSKRSNFKSILVRKSGNELLFDDNHIKSSEYDRLMLTPDWVTAFQMARQTARARDFGADLSRLRSMAGVTKLKADLFLIAGGGSEDSKASLDQSRIANLIDTRNKRILKTFVLKERHKYPTSLLLPDGKVALVGYSNNVEIVDVVHATSHLIPINLKLHFVTACLNSAGNIIVFGALDDTNSSSPLLHEVDIRTGRVRQIGQLQKGRSYVNSNSGLAVVQVNAVSLANGQYVISGGGHVFRCDNQSNMMYEDAEFIFIP